MTGFDSKQKMAADKLQDGKCKHCVDGCIACDARAQPAQEPVAWMCNAFDGEPCEQTNHDECGNPIPLYTAPPQRPWVGLTDKESIDIIKKDDAYKYPIQLLQAVMDALKAKNT
jgi:hypothetical protein